MADLELPDAEAVAPGPSNGDVGADPDIEA